MPDHVGPQRNVPETAFEAIGVADSPACGDAVRIALSINRRRVIVRTGFRVYGCASVMARAAEVLRLIKGKSVEEALKLTERALAHEVLPDNGNDGCTAAERAVLAAIRDYTSRWPGAGGS